MDHVDDTLETTNGPGRPRELGPSPTLSGSWLQNICTVCGRAFTDTTPALFCSIGCAANGRVIMLDHLGGRIPLPVEPLFGMDLAAMLIPMSLPGLRSFLSRHKDEYPARYRLQGSEHRRVRLLSAGEIKAIRAKVLRGAPWPGVVRRARRF